MEQAIIELVMKYPVAASILLVMGMARALFKPVMTVIETYVKETPSKKDDAWLEKAKNHWIYKGIAYVLDWFGSIKLPKAKK